MEVFRANSTKSEVNSARVAGLVVGHFAVSKSYATISGSVSLHDTPAEVARTIGLVKLPPRSGWYKYKRAPWSSKAYELVEEVKKELLERFCGMYAEVKMRMFEPTVPVSNDDIADLISIVGTEVLSAEPLLEFLYAMGMGGAEIELARHALTLVQLKWADIVSIAESLEAGITLDLETIRLQVAATPMSLAVH